jgi:hypothetical protein
LLVTADDRGVKPHSPQDRRQHLHPWGDVGVDREFATLDRAVDRRREEGPRIGDASGFGPALAQVSTKRAVRLYPLGAELTAVSWSGSRRRRCVWPLLAIADRAGFRRI